MANVLFKLLTEAQWAALETKDNGTLYRVQKVGGGEDFYQGSNKLNGAADIAAAIAALDATVSQTAGADGLALSVTEVDGVLTAVSGSIAANTYDTYGAAAAVVGESTDAASANTVYGAKAYADAAVNTLDGTLAAVAKSGDAADVTYDGTTSGLSATDVQGAIDAVAAASAGGVGSKTVYVTETAGSTLDPFSKRYGIYQGASGSSSSPVAGEKLVDIDIPKDMVVESGTVGTVTTADVPYAGARVGDKYIDLVIANASSDHIYIPANSLVDVYTAQQSATQIQLAIDGNNVISATVVAGSIGATELASDAVTTAKIVDGNVTLAKLATAVQTSLGLADTAVQSVAEGATAGTIAVDGTDVAVHGLADVATTGDADDVTYDNTTSGLTATDVQAAIDEISGTAGSAVQSVVEGSTNGTLAVDGTDVAVHGLGTAAFTAATAYDVAGSAAAAQTAAESYTDTAVSNALTWEVVTG